MVVSYKELQAWQKVMDLVEAIYNVTAIFPDNEKFGLASQLRRSAVSIPSNIAEGSGRRRGKECLHFLDIANGSLAESETQIMIAERLRYIDKSASECIMDKTKEVGRLINGLRRSIAMPDKSTDNRQLTTAN